MFNTVNTDAVIAAWDIVMHHSIIALGIDQIRVPNKEWLGVRYV